MNGTARAYYNEIDGYAAAWLRNLIGAGLIAPGDVDERSIVDVRPDDIGGYTQCHFFAGIGGWSYALRLAGWPDDRPVWTGSCPCQPFSAAGAGKAADDERHLWPAWFPLIAERKPAIVFGEQVEAAIGWGWLDAVFGDLEGEGYACGAAVLPACGVGAPHLRQRAWFVADAAHGDWRSGEREAQTGVGTDGERRRSPSGRASSSMADSDGRDASAEREQRSREQRQQPQDGGAFSLADAAGGGTGRDIRDAQRETPEGDSEGHQHRGDLTGRDVSRSAVGELGDAAGGGQREFGDASQQGRGGHADGAGVLNGFWSDAEWITCTDGKARPVGPGSFPLGHGIQRRPSKLRAYGNAIVPQVAAEFIGAYLDIERERVAA